MARAPDSAPSPESFRSVFRTYEVREGEDRVFYFGNPLAPRAEVLETVEPAFDERGYDVSFEERPGELVLVAEPETEPGFPWANVGLFAATFLSTLYFGTVWYHEPLETPLDLLAGLPFSVAVLSVLACHEFGHYFASKYHEVDASLPYFIPAPTFIGTMGAVIRIKSRMPDREALFDIGVAGPLAGLVATIVVSAVGLSMDPIAVPQRLLEAEGTLQIELGWPPLLRFIAWAVGEPLAYGPGLSVNPVVIGGWLGMFLTLLNLIPVGQLDGGHIVRALVGPRQETLAAAVPVALFGLGGYLHFVAEVPTGAGVWVFWGLLTTVFAYVGAAEPVRDDPLDARRKAVGVLTLVLGALCFTPVPLQVFFT
jgi:membrane-associated protease RseP (regulator of RpoE activity)